jgi:N utilization substance protein B
MLNRRLIRIKIFQVLYAHFQSESNGLQASINTLNKSLTGIQNTFNALLSLPFELAHYAETNHNPAEHKYFKKESDTRQYDLIRAEKVLLHMRKNPESLKSPPTVGFMMPNSFLFSTKKLRSRKKWRHLLKMK